MANPGQFEPKNSGGKQDPLECGDCEPYLLDLMDLMDGPVGTGTIGTATTGTIATTQREAIERHLANCPICAKTVAEMRQGHEWLTLLKKDQPKPPATLLDSILSKTSGLSAETRVAGSPPAQPPQPVWKRMGITANWGSGARGAAVPAWREPRMMLTAAMAFFSVTLSLNLAGVRLTDLNPAHLRHQVTRQYSDVRERLAQNYQNLRIVYEMESRLERFRRASESQKEKQPDQQPSKGSSSTSNPDSHGVAKESGKKPAKKETAPTEEPLIRGAVVDASYPLQAAPKTKKSNRDLPTGPETTNIVPERSMA